MIPLTYPIPEETIEKVRTHFDIVDIVSRYVPLKKSGNNLVGKCPFHTEKTPSFSVSQEKQFYHCFGCKKGGNVFSFIMEIENLTFTEAVKQLADEANILLPSFQDTLSSEEQQERETVYRAYQKAAQLYEHYLFDSPVGVEAIQYMMNRGYQLDTLKSFQVGFSPPDRDVS